MNHRTTRLLVVSALGLLAFIFFFENPRTPGKSGSADGRPRLAPFLPAAVTAIEVLPRTNLLIRVERTTNGPWRMTLPDPYEAQQDILDHFVEKLSEWTVQTTIPAGEIVSQQGGLAAFGLDVPSARIVLFEGSRRREFRLGATSPLGRQMYVQEVGADVVSVVDVTLRKWMPSHQDEWKNRSVAVFDRTKVDRIEARSEGAFYELVLNPTNRQWRLSKPFGARANPMRVETLLQFIGEARVAGFAHGMTALDLDAPGQNPPSLDLVFSQGTNVLGALEFGGSPSNRADLVFARRTSETNVFLVPRELADHFRPPHTRFRETRLTPFEPVEATAIEVRAAEAFAVRKDTNGTWKIEGAQSLAADPALVRQTLDSLATMEAVEFVQEVVADFNQFGLGDSNFQYTIRGSAEAGILAQLQLGRTNPSGGRYVRRTDEPSLYSVRQSDAIQLPQWSYELRDRNLWRFDMEAVTNVIISYQGQQRRIARSPGGGWAAWPAYASITVPLWEECLHRLGKLQVLAWVPGGESSQAKLGFSEVAHQLTIETRGGEEARSFTLNFGHLSPWNTPYATTMLEGHARSFGIPGTFYDLYELVLRELKLLSPAPGPNGAQP